MEFVDAAEDWDEEDDDGREVEEDDVEDAAALETLIDDVEVRDNEVDGSVREDEDDDDDNDNESAEPALDDAEVAAAVKLTLNVLEDEMLSTLLLLLVIVELLTTAELLIDGAALLTTDELLLDKAELAAAATDVPGLELDRELDVGRLIDKGRATCEEVGAAGIDVLRGLEDNKGATDEVVEDGFRDEVVEDGFTEVDVILDEVLLVNLTVEDEVEVGFCSFVRTMFTQKYGQYALPWSSN